MTGEETQYHHGSHRDLLESPPASPPAAPPGIQAIFVPTIRPPAYLDGAAALAMELGCVLVTLHSRKLHSKKWTTAAEAAKRLPDGLDLVAIDLAHPAALNLPRWETTDVLAGSVFACRSDLSAKRNLALLLSRMLGWSRVLFLDDDITGLNADDVRAASALLGQYNAVGLHVGGFPDHSVVCHAYRMAGGKQQQFVGGGALAIEVNQGRSFFPGIYNDDWFFLLEGNGALQPTAVTGRVIQYPYDPFRNPDRARDEELGDVLAEGIYWLLDQGRPIVTADTAYWTGFLTKRRHFIEDVLAMVRADSTLEASEQGRRIAALRGSLGRLTLITPGLCERYLRAWARDWRNWQAHRASLPTGLQIPDAIAALTRPGRPALRYELAGDIAWSVARAQLEQLVRYPARARSRTREEVAGVG